MKKFVEIVLIILIIPFVMFMVLIVNDKKWREDVD
jgi:hypothetical protein